ncbi:MAG: ribosome-associated translation inhibitor RaiA [Caldilineales bacterium]
MQLTIKGRNLEVNDQLRGYVEKKLGKMDRYLPDIQEMRVELAEEKSRKASEREVVQVTIRSNGSLLRAEVRSGDIYSAVDGAAEKLQVQIKRYKGKRRRKLEKAQIHAVEVEELEALSAATAPVAEDEEEFVEGQIVRRKQVAMVPMNEEEAIDQMDLLGHDFFVFFNARQAAVNVLYRRTDGNYGLLQPELA